MIDVERLRALAALIRETFTLDRDLVVFDLETTSSNPDDARIVEFGMVNVKLNGTQKVYRTLVNPGVPIPAEASHGRPGSGYAGHGITDEMVRGCRIGSPCLLTENEHDFASVGHDFAPWPEFANLSKSLETGFAGVDFAGTNIRYDLKVVRGEFALDGVTDWDYEDARIVDVYRIEQIGEPRTLAAIYEKYHGRRFAGAHGALADVAASIEVLNAQFKRFGHLPRDLASLHALCWDGWVDTDGKFAIVAGVPVVNFGKKWKGCDMRKVDKGYFRWMLGPDQNFAPSTRKVAEAALKGVFPV